MAQEKETENITANLVTYIKEKDARIVKLEEELAAATKRREKADYVTSRSHPEAVVTEKKEEPPAPAPHYVGKWQKYCPTCGDANPEFKDETLCSTPGCGMHLGAVEDLPKIKACPNCGGKEAKTIEGKD
jgi:ribosomal protein S27AE